MRVPTFQFILVRRGEFKGKSIPRAVTSVELVPLKAAVFPCHPFAGWPGCARQRPVATQHHPARETDESHVSTRQPLRSLRSKAALTSIVVATHNNSQFHSLFGRCLSPKGSTPESMAAVRQGLA